MPLLDPVELTLKAPVTKANIEAHVFVCTGASCSGKGSDDILSAFYSILAEKGLLYGKRGSIDGTILVTTCGSVGLCKIGPAVLIYPDGVWYYGVTPQDVPEIIEQHLIKGQPVERLQAFQVG